MTQPDLVLGYDLGTSSLKAALFDRAGRLHAHATVTYPTRFPAPGHAEQDPADWWRATVAATRTLRDAVPAIEHRVAAIGFAAQMCGTVPVDARGRPLHPCLIWLDTRSAPIARAITAGGPRIAGYGLLRIPRWLVLANGLPNLSGRDPLSKILWFRDNLPEIGSRAARFLDVKDWLLHRCTGEFTTTPDVAQLTWLMDNRIGRRQWSEAYLARFDIARDKLPSIVESAGTAGSLTAQAAAELGLRPGIAVSGGVADVNANALAAGDYSEGAYHLSLGTGMCAGCHSVHRRVNPFSGIATICAAHPDRYLLLAAQESAGAAVRWAASAFGFGDGAGAVDALDRAAAGARPTAATPLFLPWVHGERVPVDDPRLTAGLMGASLRTTRADIAYAVLAGVALNTRWALAEAQRCVKASAQPIALTGGGAESAVWPQIVADVLQRPVAVCASPRLSGARGAAITAAVVAGWLGTLDAAGDMTGQARLVEPVAGRRQWADDRYAELVACAGSRSRSRLHARAELMTPDAAETERA